MKYLMLILVLVAALFVFANDANAGGFSRSQTVVFNNGFGGFTAVQAVPVQLFNTGFGCNSFRQQAVFSNGFVAQQSFGGFGFGRPQVIQRNFRGVLGARFQSQIIR